MLNSGVYDASITAVLGEVCHVSDLEGLAVLDLSQEEPDFVVSHTAGTGGLNTVHVGYRLLVSNPGGPAHTIGPDRRPIISCPWLLPPARSGGLILWRGQRARRWTEADYGLVAAVAVLLREWIGAETGQIGIDRLTGMPNRRWFIDEADRHIDRLDLDGQVGTLSLINVDGMDRLNTALGRSAGDTLLMRLANQLRAMIRPGDIVARVGGDEIAVWQNGMDHLTAAERADALCSAHLFDDLTPGYRATFSIGIASRQFGSAEDVRALLRRAHMAAREAKAEGGGTWRVSHATDSRPGIPDE